MRRRALMAIFLATPGVVISSMSEAQKAPDPENTVYLDLKDGRVVIELLPDLAPKHVARVKELCRKGFTTAPRSTG